MNIAECLFEAFQNYQAGRLFIAEQISQQILQQDPYNIDALQLLGIIAANLGKYDLAIKSFSQAVTIAPEVADFHYNLGQAFYDRGQLDAAIATLQQALTLQPNHAGACYTLGKALQQTGDLAKATTYYQQALKLAPNHAELHNRLGSVFHAQGNLPAAITCYRQALTIQPNYIDALCNLGYALQQQHQLAEAIACYQQALSLEPNDAAIYSNLGMVLQKQGLHTQAIACYRQALAINPNYAEAYNNLGSILREQRQFTEAVTCYMQALAINPNYAEAYTNLGSAMEERGELAEAITYYRQAIAINPKLALAHNNLGSALQEQGQLDEAISCYHQALAIDPQIAMVHHNLAHTLLLKDEQAQAMLHLQIDCPQDADERVGLAYLLLLAGDFRRGFAEYEYRWQSWQTPPRPFSQPTWDGSSLAGKTILLHAEQGLGDTIQFIRYAYLVANYGGRLVVECQPSLFRLFKTIPCIDRLIIQNQPLPEFDVHAPLMSLPWILDTTLDNLPAQIPYLNVQESAIKLTALPEENLKVGIFWASDSQSKTSQKRSCPLDNFLTITDIPKISFYNLQKDVSEADRILLKKTQLVEDLSHLLNDFADTAAIVAQLDLVIAIDTSVAHLAGALGKPVWLLLPFAPDWRWMLKREDSPWYPTMRLFRQPFPGDWASVFVKVAEALQKLSEKLC